MIPVYLDPARVRVLLVGRSALALRRLAWLKAAGATPDVWSDKPSTELLAATAITCGLPQPPDLAPYQAIWIADLPRDEAEPIAAAARARGVLVNVEDVVALCDFHTPAVVRRGKLTLTAGTGGASPAVARAARQHLEQSFPEAWGEALEEIAEARAELRAGHASFDILVSDAQSRLARHGLS